MGSRRISIRECLREGFKVPYDDSQTKEERLEMDEISDSLADRFEARIFYAHLNKTPTMIISERALAGENSINEASTYLNEEEYQIVLNATLAFVKDWTNPYDLP